MADSKPTEPKAEPDESPYRPEQRPPTSDLVQQLVSEYGSADAALRTVAKERWTDRERVRIAEKERDDIKKRLEKSRLLTDDEAKEFDALKALKLTPAAITALQTENESLKAKDAERQRQDTIAEAAGLVEYTKPSVLAGLAKMNGFRVEIRDEKDGDEKVRRAYAVTGDGADAEASPLGEFVESNFGDFIPALTAGADDKPSKTNGTNGSHASNVGAPKYPAQSPRGQAPAPKQKTVDQIKEEKRLTGAYSV